VRVMVPFFGTIQPQPELADTLFPNHETRQPKGEGIRKAEEKMSLPSEHPTWVALSDNFLSIL